MLYLEDTAALPKVSALNNSQSIGDCKRMNNKLILESLTGPGSGLDL